MPWPAGEAKKLGERIVIDLKTFFQLNQSLPRGKWKITVSCFSFVWINCRDPPEWVAVALLQLRSQPRCRCREGAGAGAPAGGEGCEGARARAGAAREQFRPGGRASAEVAYRDSPM